MKWIALCLRYILGIVIFLYAYIKIVNFQFAVPDDLKLVPIKDADGVVLTFSYFGYSHWFSMFMGITQLIPALLLFFRRTAFLGAVLLFPIMTFILMINLAYDFVPFMKIWTASILAINLTLLIIYRQKAVTICKYALHDESGRQTKRTEWIVNILLVLILTTCLFFYVRGLQQ